MQVAAMFKTSAAAILLFAVAPVVAQEEPAPFEYDPPVVEKVFFDESLSMLDTERAAYATNLATFAANQVVEGKASEESLQSARRILALAMHLDRRNQTALVVNGQLKRGVLPRMKQGNYNPQSFSRILLARAKLLKRSSNERELFLAQCLVELAALIDPRNEEAVFDFEIQLLDEGGVDWRLLTDAVADKPSLAPENNQPQ